MDEQALVARSRRGDRKAFTDLYDEHAPAAWRLAVVAERDIAVAAGAVLDASVRVLGPGEHAQASAPVAVQVLAAARSAAVDTVTLPSVALQLSEQLPELAVLGTTATSPDEGVAAFDRLPEHWRTALWLRHVEQLTPAALAAVLGLTEPEAVELSGRAQQGLHEQIAQAQIRSADGPGCHRTTTRLGGYAEGTLEARDAVRVRRHLDRCEACRRRLDELDDLTPQLHRSIPVLPLTLRDLAEQRWHTAVRGAAGPLGIRLPSGAMAPAWVERVLAGATAAVVGLGITAAVALGARRGGDDRIVREAAAGQTTGATDGESALGGEAPDEGLVDDGGSIISIDPGPTGGMGDLDDPTSPTTVPPTSGSAGGGGAAPRGGSAPSSPSEPSEPTSPPSTPPSSPPTTTPPSDDPLAPIVEAVDEVVQPLPDLCTGIGTVDDLTCGTPTTTTSLGLLTR
jgi:DNA-directed RNA polymerase specialized sigma24 family protein